MGHIAASAKLGVQSDGGGGRPLESSSGRVCMVHDPDAQLGVQLPIALESLALACHQPPARKPGVETGLRNSELV